MSRMIRDERGSVPLALAAMVVLITLAVYLSSYVIGEFQTAQGEADRLQARYAAEAGVEAALYHIKNQLTDQTIAWFQGGAVLPQTFGNLTPPPDRGADPQYTVTSLVYDNSQAQLYSTDVRTRLFVEAAVTSRGTGPQGAQRELRAVARIYFYPYAPWSVPTVEILSWQ